MKLYFVSFLRLHFDTFKENVRLLYNSKFCQWGQFCNCWRFQYVFHFDVSRLAQTNCWILWCKGPPWSVYLSPYVLGAYECLMTLLCTQMTSNMLFISSVIEQHNHNIIWLQKGYLHASEQNKSCVKILEKKNVQMQYIYYTSRDFFTL